MSGIVESELRTKQGKYKKIDHHFIDIDMTKAVKSIYTIYEDQISYDAIHLMLMDISHMERLKRIRNNT